LADHWCVKGHIVLCTEGELHTELDDGREFVRAQWTFLKAYVLTAAENCSDGRMHPRENHDAFDRAIATGG
jgi:hypothetical protein